MADRYTTWGNVRGTCGHRHRSLDAAVQCLNADRRVCKSQGGYSDRGVFKLDDGADPNDITHTTGYEVSIYRSAIPIEEPF